MENEIIIYQTQDGKTKIDVKIDVDKNNVSASYDKDVLDIIPLQKGKGWDKTLNQYGIEGVKKKITELFAT